MSRPRLLLRLHRWSGLCLLLLLFVAGLTGGILAFRTEIDHSLNPDIRRVVSRDERSSLQQIVAGIETRFPDARVSTVTLPSSPDGSLIAYVATRPVTDGGSGRPAGVSEVYVDPYTGDILDARRSGPVPFGRRSLMSFVARLHYSLLLGTTGSWVMATAAVVWLLTSFIGLALAWPRRWREAGGWNQLLRLRTGQGTLTFTYGLHRTLGVLFLPIWIVLAFTSMYLGFPGLVRATVAVVSSTTPAPLPKSSWSGGPIITPDHAIGSAITMVPSATPFGFTRDFTNGRYSVRLVLPGDANPAGNSQVYVDFATGYVLALRLAPDAPAGLRFLYWQFPLHSGEAFGAAGPAIIALESLALVVMCVTGCYVWWIRRPRVIRHHHN